MERIKRICAAECTENSAVFFIRDEQGAVHREEVVFRYFLLTSLPFFSEGAPGILQEELQGQGTFRYRVSFDDRKLYDEALARLKSSTGFTPGSPNAPYRVFSDAVQQSLIQLDQRLFCDMMFSEVRRMQFDIETLCSPGYDFPNAKHKEDAVILISLSDNTGWEKVLSLADFPSEKELVQAFCKEVAERDPDILEGHNIFRFDLPYLEERAKLHKIKLTLGRDGSVIKKRSSRFNIAERTVNYTRYDIYGRHIVDTCFLLYFYDAVHRNLDSYNLKYAAKHFHIASPDRTYVAGSSISEVWKNDRETLLRYALDDVREVRGLSELLSPSWFYQTQFIPLSFQNCIVRGNATRIDALFAAEYLKKGHALPVPEKGRPFSGALTQAFEVGTFDGVEHCDVRSLYPSVILSEKWVPVRDELKIFPELLAKLRMFRLNAKDAAKRAENPEKKDYYAALQSAFKILINSFYGYLGFEQGFLNDFRMAENVTARGREILTLMLETLQEQGVRVIEMDTDGIYFQTSSVSRETISQALKKVLPEGIEIDFDESYQAMFCYKSKNYALLNSSGELSIAGAALKSRGLEPFQRKYMERVILALLHHEQNALPLIHEEFVSALKNHKFSFADLAKRETLADSPESYRKKLAEGSSRRSAAYELALRSGREYRAGDQISFYITGEKKKVAVVDAAKLLSEADETIRDENVEYYLDKLEELRKKFAPFFEQNRKDDLFAGL